MNLNRPWSAVTATDEMSNLTVLRSYAQKSNPASLPSSVLLSYTPKSLTIFDVYPKSIFHFLVLPRVTPQLAVFDLASLRTLFKADKIKAKEVLTGLSEDAQTVKVTIQDEMMKRYGFKWSVWMGFHAVPSMESVLKHRSWLFNLTSNMLAHIGMSMYTFCRPISALLQ
jgi:aprataxin